MTGSPQSRLSRSRPCAASGCDTECIHGFAYCLLHAQPEEVRHALRRYREGLRAVADVLDRGIADERKLATITRLVHGALDG